MNSHRARMLIAAGIFFLSPTVVCATDADYDPTDLTAAQILQKAENATGKLDSGRYTIIDRLISGGITSSSTTQIHGDESLTVQEGDGFTSSYGSFQGQNWTQNENGIVTYESGFHSGNDPNVLALKHPDDPQYNVKALGITTGTPREYVIEANPPGGSDQLRYYDANTFLLHRIVSTRKGYYRHVAVFEDYRHIFGAVRPFHVSTTVDGEPQNDSDLWTLSFVRSSAQTSFAPPESKQLFTLSGDKPLTLPATFTRNGIIVRVSIQGRGLDFLLDSGADGLYIDPGVAHDLGLKTFGRSTTTIGGDIDVSITRVPELHIGALTLRDTVFNVAPVSWETGQARVVGLLGFDFIANAVLGIDFKKATATLYPQTTFDPQDFGLSRQAIQLDDGIPRAIVSFEQHSASVLLDTGSAKSIAYDAYLKHLPDVRHTRRWAYFGAVGGDVLAEWQDVSNLSFAGILYRTVPLLVPTDSSFDLQQYDGLLGRDVLSNYQLFFDYAGRMIYIKPNV